MLNTRQDSEVSLTGHSQLEDWGKRLKQDEQGNLFEELLVLDPETPPPPSVIYADIGPTFTSDNSDPDPKGFCSPSASAYVVAPQMNSREHLRGQQHLKEEQLRFADARADLLLPPDIKKRAPELRRLLGRKWTEQVKILVNLLNRLRRVMSLDQL